MNRIYKIPKDWEVAKVGQYIGSSGKIIKKASR